MANALLCCTDEKRSWEIRQALSDAGVDVSRQYQSTQTLLAALAQYGDEDTDLLVIDESSSPMPMWDLASEVSGRYPSTAVLTVVAGPTSEDYATALDSGSRGVISYPLNFENVAARVQLATAWGDSLRKAVQRSRDDEHALGAGKMVTVASAKGGTGSSTVALHLALEAAQTSDRKVVLVDLDLQKPDQSILIDAPRHRDITDLLTVVDELSSRFIADVLFDHPAGLAVLFGPAEGERGELITEAAAKKILGILRARFDVVVVDVGAVMGEANATAVEMADQVCVVSQADVLSLRGVRRLASLWERIGARQPESIKVVLNGVHNTNDIQPESARKIIALQSYRTVLPRTDRPLEQAVNRRDPSMAGSDWANKIQDLGREMQIVPPVSLAKGAKEGPGRTTSSRRRKAKGTSEDPSSDEQPQLAGAGAPTRRRVRNGRESGQSAIEFLGVAMLFIATAAIAFQLVLVGATWILASHSASEGARAAAVGEPAGDAARSATPGSWQNGMSVNSTNGRVSVALNTPALFPMTEDLIVPIEASAGILEEP